MPILKFSPSLASLLPETFALLGSSNLTLHPSVARVILHGSRGLAGGFRLDSDVDLSILVDVEDCSTGASLENRLRDAFATTLVNWQGPVEVDLAAVFDIQRCGLRCFNQTRFEEGQCPQMRPECFGLYKLQKGFHGFVTHAGVEVRLMNPCLMIWERV
jgi:hypothetical protein